MPACDGGISSFFPTLEIQAATIHLTLRYMGVKGYSFSIANHVKYIYTIMPAVKMLETQIVTLLN